MEFGGFDEFWAALNRLYEANVKNGEDIRDLRASIGELREVAAHLANAVQTDHDVIMEHERRVQEHERRHDRTEITVEAILEDLRRHREGRSPQ